MGGNATVAGTLGVTGATTMTGVLTANGGINSGSISINPSDSNSITGVNTLGARQGNFGSTSGIAGVVNVRDGAATTISLDGASGQVSAASVAAGGLQVHTNSGTDVAGAGGLQVTAGSAGIGVRNTANTAWNGLSVTDSSASLRGGTASTTLTLGDGGMTVADTTNGQTLAVSNAGALSVGGDGTVGNTQAGSVNVTNGAGTNTITLDGTTGVINATSVSAGTVTATNSNVANVNATNSISTPNAYLGGTDASAPLVVTPTSVTYNTGANMNGNKITGLADGTNAHDAANWGQVQDVRKEARRGIAGAAALAGLPALETGKQYNFGVGVGHYKGESALSLGGHARINPDTTAKFGVGFTGSDATVSAGIGWSF